MSSNEIISVKEFNCCGVEDEFSSTYKSFDSKEGKNKGEQSLLYGDGEWGASWGIESLSSGMSPPLQNQTCLEKIPKIGEIENGIQELVEPMKKKQHPFSLASLELFRKYGNGLKRLNTERKIEPSNDTPCTEIVDGELSTEEIMRIAGAKFIQSAIQLTDVPTMLDNPFYVSFSGLSDEEAKNVELAELLLAAAEKVGNQQFNCANRLLNLCDYLSSNTGNPVQRLVYYFSGALRERIDRVTGRSISKGLGKQQSINMYEVMMSPSLSNIAFHQGIPFSQISHFAGIQVIVENVAKAQKIHVIDLEIRSGLQWTILMQGLVSQKESPPELLKITAVGTTSKQLIEGTGKRLTSFAQTMNIPFSFKILMVTDILDLKEDCFELDAEEIVAVFSEYLLTSLIAVPNRLDSVMKVIRNINPCIMVITEVEANHNSPVFVNRFIEALFYLSAYFDCLDACMKRDDPNRMIAESMFFGEGIRNVLASEGEERSIRNVKIDVWRAFFARFGMEETELSMSSLYQANLVAKKFACGSSCTVVLDGKSLVIGWKGTPIHSLSAWKFA